METQPDVGTPGISNKTLENIAHIMSQYNGEIRNLEKHRCDDVSAGKCVIYDINHS